MMFTTTWFSTPCTRIAGLIFVAVHKLSNERRNCIPYSLWVTQPWTNSRKRRCARAAAADIARLCRQLIASLEEGLQLPP